jgi:hypothetical protein
VWPTLRSHLALIALDEHSPLKLLTAAVSVGSLADARDPAAVLDARVDDLVDELNAARTLDSDTPPPTDGPLPWLPAIPSRLAGAHDWGPFATAYHQLVREQIDAVREEAQAWTGATAPVWAQPFLADEDADLRSDLAVWRAVARTAENDLAPHYVRLRNICAHHGWLWNVGLGVYPALPSSSSISWLSDGTVITPRRAKQLYPVLVSLQSVLDTISPHSSWARRLSDLLADHPHLPLRGIGMPENWRDDPFWAKHLE